MNKDIYKYIIYILLSFLSFFLHYNSYTSYNKKKITLKIIIIEFLHSFISIYLYFGSLLFGYYEIHTIIIILLLIMWKFFKGKCPITIYINNEMNQDKNTRFRDIGYHIEKQTNINFYIIIMIILFYNIYNIIKN